MIMFDFDIEQRMNLQRKILKAINSKFDLSSQLNGLSNASIDLWEKNNNIRQTDLIQCLKEVSESLFVLSTRSLESISLQELNIKQLEKQIQSLNSLIAKI